MPTDRTPHNPQTPKTEIAPTGSSIRSFSTRRTLITTSTPAMAPMTAAGHDSTKATGAAMATQPDSRPWQSVKSLNRRSRTSKNKQAATPPETGDSRLLSQILRKGKSEPDGDDE